MGTALAYNMTEEDVFPNVEYIHPLMQKTVSIIVKWAKKKEKVTAVIIFGSSVTNYCNSYSDCDVYIGGIEPEDVGNLELLVDYELDIIFDFMLGTEEEPSAISCEIAETGVVVYVKDND